MIAGMTELVARIASFKGRLAVIQIRKLKERQAPPISVGECNLAIISEITEQSADYEGSC